MSLIIASNYENTIEILSDTKLNYEDDKNESLRELHYDTGIIKVKYITENIILAFAGELLYAEKAYLAVDGLEDIDIICEKLLSIHIMSVSDITGEPQTDFLIASNIDNKRDLISVKNCKIIKGCKRAYIGDFDAYSQYLEYCNNGVDYLEDVNDVI